MRKYLVASFCLMVFYVTTLSGCRQSVGLGTFIQDINAGTAAYPVKIASIGQDMYGRTTVGIQSTGANKFTRASLDKPPIGAYLVNGDEEHQYKDYYIDDEALHFQFDTRSPPDRIIIYPTAFPDDVLKQKAFNGRTKEAIRFFVPEQWAIDLNTLLDQKKIRVEIVGRSMERTAISITNTYFTVLPVKIGIGTWFDSRDDVTQNMAVTRDVCFIAEPHQSYTITVPTACMNRTKSSPDRRDTFAPQRLGQFKEYRELGPLVKLLRDHNISDELIQLAVWVLTNERADYWVNNLEEYFRSNTAGLSTEYANSDVETAKRIIRQVHKPKGMIPIIR